MNTVICLMGPTASGKTDLAVALAQRVPCEIISVDSAMVYRGLDIGSAKPDTQTLKIAPHKLIDICDPGTPYSAGEFRRDALAAIKDSLANGKIPLLVGGTMLYFRVLQQGLAELPGADAALRARISAQAAQEGWESLHRQLAGFDPKAAARIHLHDCQRIQRAIEVYHLTGKPISTWQAENTSPLADYNLLNYALMPGDRQDLHARIAARFEKMLADGLVDEVTRLYERGDLHANLPSIRSVGYRQVWDYLDGHGSFTEMREKAVAATRQLAKRQMTWLRSWPHVKVIENNDSSSFAQKELAQRIINI